MQIYPAIDLKEGKCVRLKQGDYNQLTVYGEDPVSVALKWQKEGASFLHLVDLDGAKEGTRANEAVICQIAKRLDIPIQLGGGIRTLEDIQFYLEAGIERVILGSVAIQNPALVQKALALFGAKQIVVGIDARKGQVAIGGWLEVTDQSAIIFGKRLKEWGIKTIIYTDISKDGMMQGPNGEETLEMAQETGLEVIASGGISKLEDLQDLAQKGVPGAIVGKALYTNAFTLKEALVLQGGNGVC